MEVIILNTPEAVATLAADLVSKQVNQKANAVLGMATGGTPLKTYEKLIEKCSAKEVSFKQASTFNLDEYIGLPSDHPRSYRYFMRENLFDHIDIDPENTHIPDGLADNPIEVGPAYEKQISEAGGIDLQILGIGSDGHIGFNEPTSSMGSRTRIKTLTERTLEDNQRFFKPGETQPTLAITMGIQTIMEARHVILLANGAGKANAIRETVEGPLSARCPASILQFHPRATVIIDEEASSALELTAYYKRVREEQEALLARFDPRG